MKIRLTTVFWGGPADGTVVDRIYAREAVVPLCPVTAAKWEIGERKPRIRPRGLREGVYRSQLNGRHFAWVGVR